MPPSMGRFRKFCENEENFFEVLDDMLDIATVLPVCEYEYASKLDLFRQFEHVYDALLELKEMLFIRENSAIKHNQL